MLMKILALTGATGKKSGGALSEEISKNLDNIKTLFPNGIRAIVRCSSNTEKLEQSIPNIDIARGELTDVEFLKRALKNVDTCVHVAGIHWSRQIVEAAAYCSVRRLILVHTTGIYSKYKVAGEEYRHIDEFVYKTCKENGIILTICRPTMIYGNVYDHNIVTFIKMVDKFPFMPVVNGARYELQPVHYSDLGLAFYMILINEGSTANKDFVLSGAEPILLRDMLEEIGKNLGKRVRFISFPYWFAYLGACVVYYLTFKKKDFREKVQRLCEPRAYSHTDASVAFGYQPIPFKEGIAQEVIEYKSTKR